MNVENKQESDNLIRKMNLNRMLDGVFDKNTLYLLPQFLSKNVFPYYNLRDKASASGEFLYQKTAQEILTLAPNYTKFSVYESLAEADKKLILQGDIQIDNDFNLLASLSDIKLISNRKAMESPVYHLNIDLKEKREPYIKGLSEIINYIVRHELIGAIVEFSLFDLRVGINKENIIIWEIRNY